MATTRIIFDGADGSFKSSTIAKLQPLFPNVKFVDRDRGDADAVYNLTLKPCSEWPVQHSKAKDYIIFLCDPLVSYKRITSRGMPDQYESMHELTRFYSIYCNIIFKYGLKYIDTTHMTCDDVVNTISAYIKGELHPRLYEPLPVDSIAVPDIPPMDFVNEYCHDAADASDKKELHYDDTRFPKMFNDLRVDHPELIVSGNSRTIIEYPYKAHPDDVRFHVIRLKETLYSHSSNKAGIVHGTYKPRMDCTRVIMDLFHMYAPGLYTYVCVGEQNIVAFATDYKQCEDEECVVKTAQNGTDKHRYLFTNADIPVLDDSGCYVGEPLYRPDRRCPNFVNGQRHGDQCMYEDFRQRRYPMNKKWIALSAFSLIEGFFEIAELKLVDMCFMINGGGHHGKIYGEISPDCARIQDMQGASHDKDLWRKGESVEKIVETWTNLAHLLKSLWIAVYKDDIGKIAPRMKYYQQPSVDVLIGGFYSDEGKGYIVDKLQKQYDVVLRANGCWSSSHVVNGKMHFHSPSIDDNGNTIGIIGPGMNINLDVLMQEFEQGHTPFIHVDCAIIQDAEPDDVSIKYNTMMSGNRRTEIDRLNKKVCPINYYEEIPVELIPYLVDDADYRNMLSCKRVLIEGSHGRLIDMRRVEYCPCESTTNVTCTEKHDTIDATNVTGTEKHDTIDTTNVTGTEKHDTIGANSRYITIYDRTSSPTTAEGILYYSGISAKCLENVYVAVPLMVSAVGNHPLKTFEDFKVKCTTPEFLRVDHACGQLRERKIGPIDIDMLMQCIEVNPGCTIIMTMEECLKHMGNKLYYVLKGYELHDEECDTIEKAVDIMKRVLNYKNITYVK